MDAVASTVSVCNWAGAYNQSASNDSRPAASQPLHHLDACNDRSLD